MKLSKITLGLALITFVGLIYVYQQTQIFHIAYQNNKKQAKLQDSLDRNNVLKYNIGVYSSLPYLDRTLLAKYADFEIPQGERLVRLAVAEGEGRAAGVRRPRRNLFARFFNIIVKQAEAKPIER